MTLIQEKKETITEKFILNWLRQIAVVMNEHKEYLTELDAAIGDADHGINMARGFNKVMEEIEDYKNNSIGSILKQTGMALISSVGGAAGPLYGSFFLQAGNSLGNNGQVTAQAFYECLLQGLAGVKSRGRALVGEKTLIDTMEPAIVAVKTSLNSGNTLLDALAHAVLAAEVGMLSTIDMQAKKGRASYLGARSIGHQDPGATSAFYLFQTLYHAAQAELQS